MKEEKINLGKWYSYKECVQIARELTMEGFKFYGTELCDIGTHGRMNGAYGCNIWNKIKQYC